VNHSSIALSYPPVANRQLRERRQARASGRRGGLTLVMDRCLKVEHARYVGRMHWLGFNTQRITSVRGGLQ